MTLGHNSDAKLRSLISRIVNLEVDKANTAEAIRDLYAEVKSGGYDQRAVRVIVKRQLETNEKREKRESLEEEVERLLTALGPLADLPLGQAAVAEAH